MPRGVQETGKDSRSASRQRGSRSPETLDRLLDATTQLLLDEGYGAITTRRIGEKAGLNYQLVHYYFDSLDDLFIATFRRAAERNLQHLAELVRGEPSLRDLWNINAEANGGKLTIEFVALAGHRPALKREIARYARRFREAQLELARAALAREAPGDTQVPPMVVLLLMTGLAQLIALDRSLGVTDGHDQVIAWIQEQLTTTSHP